MAYRGERKEERIEIAYAIHDYYGYYYEYLGTSMVSVMENTKASLTFRILCDASLSPTARKELSAICDSYGQQIYFYDIALDERVSIVDLLKAGYSEGILYRLYLPELLSDVSKIIYLDADLITHGDICGLWDVDVTNYAIAGRWDPPMHNFLLIEESLRKKCQKFWDDMDWTTYVNSGVLVMNLDKLRREHHLMEEAIAFWDEYGMVWADQDAINWILHDEITFIPYQYNMRNKVYPVVKEGIFYHFINYGEHKEALDDIDRLYLSYWEKTPFYNSSYGEKEQLLYLRRMKTSLDVYERLKEYPVFQRDNALTLGVCLYDLGEYQKAYDYLADDALEKLPIPDYGDTGAEKEKQDHFWQLLRTYTIARSLVELGRKEEAIESLRSSLQAHDRHNGIALQQWYLLGEILYDTGKYEEAEEAFTNCLYFGTISEQSYAESALVQLVKCSLHRKDIIDAKKYHNMLRSITPLNDVVRVLGIQIEIAERKSKKN